MPLLRLNVTALLFYRRCANHGETTAERGAAVAAEEQRMGAAVGTAGRGRGKIKGVADDHPSSTADNPNVFFIMIDDMGWNDIGYHSTDLANVTPNLDRLSASGVKVRRRLNLNFCMYVNPWKICSSAYSRGSDYSA